MACAGILTSMGYSDESLESARKIAVNCKTMAEVVARTGMSSSTLQRHGIGPGRRGGGRAQATATLRPGSVDLAKPTAQTPQRQQAPTRIGQTPQRQPARHARAQGRPLSLADRRRIAAQSSDEYVLQTLIKDPEPSVKESLAGNRHITAEMQRTLASAPEMGVCFALATRPPDDPKAMRVLSTHDSYEVRLHIARCGDLRTLKKLASDEHEIVRAMVPLSPKANADLVNSMGNDDSPAVLENVLASPHVSLATVKSILARTSDPRVLGAIAAYPHADSALLDEVFERTSDAYVWAQIAAHPNASPERLTSLANSKSPEVRTAVAANTSTPLNVVETQSMSKNLDVATAARETLAMLTGSFSGAGGGVLAPTF